MTTRPRREGIATDFRGQPFTTVANCRGDGKLMRRRRGTNTWTEVTE